MQEKGRDYVTKKELADRLIEQNGGSPFITQTDMMRLFKMGYQKVSAITTSLTPIKKGSGKSNRATYYFIDDVAEQIMKEGL